MRKATVALSRNAVEIMPRNVFKRLHVTLRLDVASVAHAHQADGPRQDPMLRTTDELSVDELSADFAAIAARGDRLRLKFYAGLRSDALTEIDASGLAFVTRTIGVFKYAVVADRLIQCLWTMRLENFVEAAQDCLGLSALRIVMAASHLVLGPLKSCGDRKARPRSPVVCTENLIRVDAVTESPKLAE